MTSPHAEDIVMLPFGTCEMVASENCSYDHRLRTITVHGPTDDLERLEQVVGDHLARFAFREPPTLTWQRSA